jgi:hypothetical protein
MARKRHLQAQSVVVPCRTTRNRLISRRPTFVLHSGPDSALLDRKPTMYRPAVSCSPPDPVAIFPPGRHTAKQSPKRGQTWVRPGCLSFWSDAMCLRLRRNAARLGRRPAQRSPEVIFNPFLLARDRRPDPFRPSALPVGFGLADETPAGSENRRESAKSADDFPSGCAGAPVSTLIFRVDRSAYAGTFTTSHFQRLVSIKKPTDRAAR